MDCSVFLLFVLLLQLGPTLQLVSPPKLEAFPGFGNERPAESYPLLGTSSQRSRTELHQAKSDNIILNPRFEDGLNDWSGRGCQVLLRDSIEDAKVLPQYGKFFASATNRTANWNGIQQEITGRVQPKLAYQVSAVVRVSNLNSSEADVKATLWVQTPDIGEEYIGIGIIHATDKDWVHLVGEFLIETSPLRAFIFLEGPPPGTDILINNLVVQHDRKINSPPVPKIKGTSLLNATFGVNVVENNDLESGTAGWFPLGSCVLSTGTGSPHEIPPMAKMSLGLQQHLSGRCVIVTNRTDTWMGPAQMINNKLKAYLTYQVSAWVRIGSGATRPQIVNVALGVDGKWVNGGQVESNAEGWHEIGGSFRFEKQPSNVMVYVQGPDKGVDLLIAGLQIFPVDRKVRFNYLKKQTDKIRKRDIILKFSTYGTGSIGGSSIEVTQIQNNFPLGSCMSRASIDNEKFVDFLVKNFNWVVFGNELKWSWIESQRGSFRYKDADELVDFCKNHSLEIRGHCIFWEADYAIQPWVQSLDQTDLSVAVQNHISDLLTHYKGVFRHYDIDNEMLHGSFYGDRLGKGIHANMFKMARQLDPSATLFVNDYHIEDGSDIQSSPEKYIQQIQDLQDQGAQVGGIGIQGHIESPVGPVVSCALDKLGTLGLPIWFTELDVSSTSEYVRADDLEVMLREAYAHPAVEGIILWGFWELYMSRENAHLVSAEGKINEAGRRFLALKREWLSSANGNLDALGEFRFRGFSGTYNVEITSPTQKINKTFVVDRGESPLVVSIDL